MIGTTPRPQNQSAADTGISAHLLAFFASLAGYFRARIELAGIEGKEAASIYLKVALLLVCALGALAFGYAFLWIGLIAGIAALSHLHWGWLVLGVGVLHLLGAMGCVGIICRVWKKPVFTATLEEFRKDQEWLNSHK